MDALYVETLTAVHARYDVLIQRPARPANGAHIAREYAHVDTAERNSGVRA